MAEKPNIPFDDFIKLDLRVATVKACEPHPNADRLLKIQLDDGSGEDRQVCAGIKQWYQPDELVGKRVVIVANLEPRKIRGEVSQGMILAAIGGRDKTPDLWVRRCFLCRFLGVNFPLHHSDTNVAQRVDGQSQSIFGRGSDAAIKHRTPCWQVRYDARIEHPTIPCGRLASNRCSQCGRL